jgi:RNA polymerase sigma factor (sigma-70 family)
VGVQDGPDSDGDVTQAGSGSSSDADVTQADPGSDADVMRASVDDPARFQTLFERHFELIFRYAGRRLGRQAAEDVSAEVFLKAFEARGRYDFTYSDARPWLFGIAANVMRRSLRTEGRRLRALAREPLRPAGALDDALVRLDSQATDQRLAAALAALRSDEREALLLVAWADLTYDEVARALGIPVGTVRSRLHRARARMSKELGGKELGAAGRAGSAAGVRRSDRGGSPAPRRIGDRAGSAAAARRTHDYDTLMTAPRPVALKEDIPWTTSI